MSDDYKLNDKNERFLTIFTRLLNNERLQVKELAEQYGCSTKTITRDFERMEEFFTDFNIDNTKSFMIQNINEIKNEPGIFTLIRDESKYMSRAEIIALCKILIEARALSKKELEPVIDKLIDNCLVQGDKKFIKDLISNQKFNYVEPSHGKPLLDLILEISKAIKAQRILKIEYKKPNGSTVNREIEPLGLIFNEFYFYLAGNLKNVDKSTFQIKFDTNPTVYRLDRIENLEIQDSSFNVQEIDRFKEGEFRKKIQFMFTGEIYHIKMLVKQYNYEIIKDKLPNAEFKKVKNDDYDYVMDAELFGEGILIWLLGQGDGIKLIGPDVLVDKLKSRIEVLHKLYF